MSKLDANCVSFPLSPPKIEKIARSQKVCKAVSKNCEAADSATELMATTSYKPFKSYIFLNDAY